MNCSCIEGPYKQRTGSNVKFNDIICMAASAGSKAVFFPFLTEAAITPRLLTLLTPKLACIILITISSDGACYFFIFFVVYVITRGHLIQRGASSLPA